MECGKNAAMKLWFIIAACLLGCHGNTDIFPKIGTLSPYDPHILVGSTLVLNCTLYPPYNTTGVYFLANQTNISSEYVRVVSDRVAVLEIPDVPAQLQTYTCKLPYAVAGALFPAQRVQVSYAPGPVRNLTCLVDNWTSMTCTWRPGVTDQYLVTNYSLAYSIASTTLYKCPHQTTFSCRWIQQDSKGFFQYRKTYYIRVRAWNIVGQSFVEEYISTTTIVKPNPVKRLHVVSVSSTSVKLSWKSPSPTKFRPATFRVSYQTADTQSPKTVETDKKFVLLNGLEPYTQYKFTVAAAPKPQFKAGSITYKQGGFWSEDEYVTTTTLSDVPSALPPFVPGAYQLRRIVGNSGVIKVQIYWQKLSSRLANGIVTQYKVRMETCLSTIEKAGYSPQPAECAQNFRLVNPNKTLLTQAYEVPDHKTYTFWVAASSDKGYNDSLSKTPVMLVNPDTTLKPPSDVVAFQIHANATASHMKVNWTQVEGATSYTVFWCYGKLVATCEEDINWMKVTREKHTADIFLDSRAYMFAVSAETTEGSTGMSAWTNRTYLIDAEAVPVTDLKLSEDQAGESLTLEWTAPHSARHVYVMFYVLSYCSSVNAVCTGKEKNITIPRYLEQYKLTNLKVDQQYKVVLYTVAPSGVSPASLSVIGTAQPSGLRRIEVGGIVCGVILAALLCIMGCYAVARKICKGRQKFLSLKIEVPARITVPKLDIRLDKDMLDTDEEDRYDSVTTPTSVTGLLLNCADERHYQDNKENVSREDDLQMNSHLPNDNFIRNANNNFIRNDDDRSLSVGMLQNDVDSEENTEDGVFHRDSGLRKHDISSSQHVPEKKIPPGGTTDAQTEKKESHSRQTHSSGEDEYHKFALGNVSSPSPPLLGRLQGVDYLGINNNKFVSNRYIEDSDSADESFKEKSKVLPSFHCVTENAKNSAFCLNSNNSNSSPHILSKMGQHAPPGVDVNEGNPEYDSGFQCGCSGHSSDASPEKVMPKSGQAESIEVNSLDYAKLGINSDSGISSGDCVQFCSPEKGSKSMLNVVDTLNTKNQEDKLTMSVPLPKGEGKTAKLGGYVTLPDEHTIPSPKTVQMSGYVTLPEVSATPLAGEGKIELVPTASGVDPSCGLSFPSRNEPASLANSQHRQSPSPTTLLCRKNSLPMNLLQKQPSAPPNCRFQRQTSPLTSVSHSKHELPSDEYHQRQQTHSNENSPIKSRPQKQSTKVDVITLIPYHQLTEITKPKFV